MLKERCSYGDTKPVSRIFRLIAFNISGLLASHSGHGPLEMSPELQGVIDLAKEKLELFFIAGFYISF